MTPEQKFFYDLKGWLLIPGVLMNSEIEVMKQEITAGAKHAYQGTLQNLLDHPCIVDILGEIVAHPPYPNEEAYGFRCEQSFVSVRRPGWQEDEAFPAPLAGVPHVVAPPQQANAMRYQVAGNRIYSGLTRVVWESDLTHPLIARFNVPLASFDRTDGGIAPRRNHRLNRQRRSRLGIGQCAVST